MTDQKPLVLGFDTSGPHCAAALVSGDNLLDHRIEEMAKGQAERLMPLLEDMLAAQDLSWSALDAFGVGVGPGNFTGIRLSVAAARGLALSTGKPAIGVSTFQAMAFGYDAPVLCSLDAKRDQVYAQILNEGQTAPVHCTIDNAPLPHPRAEAAVIGHRAKELALKTGGSVLEAKFPLAEAIARKAALRAQNTNIPAPAPLYIKPADAAPSKVAPPVILS